MKRFYLSIIALLFVAAAQAQAPKYVILMIGDGMGLTQIQLFQEQTGTEFWRPEAVGLAATCSADNKITDSAAAGTALATGEKTKNKTIGLSADHSRELTSIAERARDKGMRVGIITTVSVDHATPAAFYANVPDREMHLEIGRQMLASGFDYIAGLPPLAKELDVKVPEGMVLNTSKSSLAKRMVPALEHLKNDDGFFLMAEGGLIDWTGHSNDTKGTVREVKDFNEAVKHAVEFYERHPQETLLVVTADHETGGLTLTRKGAKWSTGDHTSLPAVVFAAGVGSEKFAGFYDNTDIPKKIIEIAEL